jgi:hypothetical protein
MAQQKDSGTLKFRDGKLHFRFDTGEEVRVAQSARLEDHSDPGVAQLVGQEITIEWAPIHEIDHTLFLMVFKVILHQDIAVRAFEIYQSNAGGTAVENWLSAEDGLLNFSLN